MKIIYTTKRLSKKRRDMINKIDNIISEYSAKGIQLTVRQCYYQCVSRGIMHNNSASYTKISELIADGRLAGLLDWDAIEDRTRYTRENSHWISPKEIIDDAVEMYQIDTRATQPIYVECWIEKDSLVSILEETCRRLDVPCCSCRGFPSITMLHEASQRFQEHDHSVLLYAGDHDPSGLTIPESIKKAFNQFGVDVDFRRIGITLDQIASLDLVPFPAKVQDKNFKKYVETTGQFQAWELDALPPEMLSAMFENEINSLTDFDKLKQLQRLEQADRLQLAEIRNSLS